MLLNVLDYETPLEALNDALDGDRVYFPAVKTWIAPENGWLISKSLEIFGDGPGDAQGNGGTRLVPGSPSGDVFILNPAGGPPSLANLHFHDLRISGRMPNGGKSGRDGIRFDPVGQNRKLSTLRLERVVIDYMAGRGINLNGTDGDKNAVVACLLSESGIDHCGEVGLYLRFVFQAYLERCLLLNNAQEGCFATASEVALTVCRLAGNSPSSGSPPRPGRQLTLGQPGEGAMLLARVDACHFLDFAEGPACRIENAGGAAQVGGCLFDLAAYSATAIGLEVAELPNAAMLILPNRFKGVGRPLVIADSVVACVVLPQYSDTGGTGGSILVLPSATNDAPVAIPSLNGPSGNGLSGLLVPAMTAVSSLNLQNGMLRLDNSTTPGKFQVRVDSEWKDIRLLLPIELAIPAAGRHSLIITWTAPTDPQGGSVQAYDLRRSTSPITEANFASASVQSTSPPSVPSVQECVTANQYPENGSLQTCTTYYFAIKYQTQGGEWSPMSNVPSRSTLCSGSTEVECS